MKKVRKVFNLMIFIGIVVLIGTAGASDIGTLSLREAAMQVLFSVLLIAAGFCGRQTLVVIKKRKKKKLSYFTEFAA